MLRCCAIGGLTHSSPCGIDALELSYDLKFDNCMTNILVRYGTRRCPHPLSSGKRSFQGRLGLERSCLHTAISIVSDSC